MASSPKPQQTIKDLFKEFSKPSASIENVGSLLDQLLPQLFPLDLSNSDNPEMRQVLEIACFHAAYTFDGNKFEKYFAMLLTNHYLASERYLKDSNVNKQSLSLIGMQLLNLLVSGRMNEFNLLLAKLPLHLLHTSFHLKFVLDLHEALLEGPFHRIIASKDNVPSPEYRWFIEGLMDRIRIEIATCLRATFDRLPTKTTMELLLIETGEKELFAKICHMQGWQGIGNETLLNPGISDQPFLTTFHPQSILVNNLHYAKHLESFF
jgi:hypothetical protein